MQTRQRQFTINAIKTKKPNQIKNRHKHIIDKITKTVYTTHPTDSHATMQHDYLSIGACSLYVVVELAVAVSVSVAVKSSS